MSYAFNVGRFIGSISARTVHTGGVLIEGTGQAGRDLVAGSKAGYSSTRCHLAEQRAAKYAAIASAMKARVEATPVAAPEVFRGKVPLTA